jgi:hypothetical protein
LINNSKFCRKCEKLKPTTAFYVSKTIKSGKPVYFSYCKLCVNARMKRNRDRKKASIEERIVELLSKSEPMTSKEISIRLDAHYKSVAMICSLLRKKGAILCVTYHGDMPAYSAPPIKKQEQALEKGVTQADLDYQAYYRLPRHARRALPPPAPAVGGAAEMQSFRFAFGNDYTVKTAGIGPW